jgi:hypothetical protein
MNDAKSALKGLGFCLWSEFSGESMQAFYFETPDGFTGVLFAPNETLISLDQSVMHHGANVRILSDFRRFSQCGNAGKLAQIDNGSYAAISMAFYRLIVRYFDIRLWSLLRLRHENALKEFIGFYEKLEKGIYPEKNSHITDFGWIYCVNVALMAEVFGSRPISVHDVATNVCHFPLMLATLPEDRLMGLHIAKVIASDLNIGPARFFLSRYCRIRDTGRLELVRYDLVKQMDLIPVTDVVIANDLLEHLDEQVSRQVLNGLWSKARKLLMIHVPFEESPMKAFGHVSSFNEAKLRAWAQELKGGILLTKAHFMKTEISLCDHGYLVMVKE